MRILLLVLCLTVLRGQLGAAAVNSMISCNNNFTVGKLVNLTCSSNSDSVWTCINLTCSSNSDSVWTCININESCSITLPCNSSASDIAVAAIVTPLLLALVGGIIATIILIKKRRKVKVLLPTFGRRLQHGVQQSLSSLTVRFSRKPNSTLDMDNPTYGTESGRVKTTATSPNLPVYETVFVVENQNAETDEDINYDVICEQPEIESSHDYDTVCVDTDADYDTISIDDVIEVQTKPTSTAYAISAISLDTKEPEPPKKAGKYVTRRINSLEASSQKLGSKNGKHKKPVPRPKPKLSSKDVLVKSASVSQVEKYSQVDPKTKYAELEPHIVKQGGVEESITSDRKPQPKDEYSHLKH